MSHKTLLATAIFAVLAGSAGWLFLTSSSNPTRKDRMQEIMTMPLDAADHLMLLTRYEALVEETWRQARKPLLEGKTEFKLLSSEGPVYFSKAESAESNPDKRQSYFVGDIFGAAEGSGILQGMFKFNIKEGNFKHVEFYPGTKALSPTHLKLDFGNYPGS